MPTITPTPTPTAATRLQAQNQVYQVTEVPETSAVVEFFSSQFDAGAPAKAPLVQFANPVKLDTTQESDLVGIEAAQQLNDIVTLIKGNPELQQKYAFASSGGNQPGVNIAIAGADQLVSERDTAARVIAKRLNCPLWELDLGKVTGATPGETMRRLTAALETNAAQGAVLYIRNSDILLPGGTDVTASERQIAAHLESLLSNQKGVVLLGYQNGREARTISSLVAFVLPILYPSKEDRLEIWKKAIPTSTPVASTIDLEKLAAVVNLSGPSIRNVTRNAASRAIASKRPLEMRDLVAAIKAECLKNGQLISDSNLRELGETN